jgi:hypothetical protein
MLGCTFNVMKKPMARKWRQDSGAYPVTFHLCTAAYSRFNDESGIAVRNF